MNNISTIRLARVTNDALDNLEQDPQAVERAIDAYQGSIPVDRSQGNNLRRQAESYQNLFDAITSEVPKAIGTLSKVGEQEAFDEWQQASPKEQETWRAAVKNNEVGPWHSPFFNRGMEKMVANDHVLKYATQYQTTYATARTSGDKKFQDDQGQFDLTKFNQTTLKTYQEENGLLNMSGQAYAIFARGTGPIHAEATAKNAEAKAAVIMGNHVDLFGKTALNFARTLGAKEAGVAISKHMKEQVTANGLDSKKYHAQVEAVFTNTYIEHIKAGLDGEKYIEAWGETLTGSGSQKLKDLPMFATKVALIRARGDAAAKTRGDMEDWKKTQEVNKTITGFQTTRENSTNRLLTDKQFINQETNEGYLEIAKLWHNSTDPLKKKFSARILGMRGGALTDEAFNHLILELLNEKTFEEAELILSNSTAASRHYIEFGKAYDLNQDAKLGVSGVEFKTNRDGWLAKGYEDALGANRPGEIPRNRLDIKRGLRANWDAELSTVRRQTLAAGILRINSNKDLSEPERQEKLEELVTKANTDYEDGMQAKLAEVVAEKTAIQEDRQKAEAKEKVRAAHIKNMGDEGKGQWMRGDKHLDDRQRLLKVAATAVKDSQFQKDALINADKALMRSYRFKQAAESLGLEPTLENISAVADQMRLITSDIYGPKGAPKTDITPEQKKEIQESIWDNITSTLGASKDSFLNLAPESVAEVIDTGLDGIQRGVESLPENTLEAVKSASGVLDKVKGTLGDIGLPGFEEAAGEVVSAVTDAVLGKEAHAADTPQGTGVGTPLTDADKVALKESESNTGVSGSGRTVSGHTMAQTYNASTTKEKAQYEVGLAKVRKQLATGVGLTPAMKKNITMMKGHFKSGVGAFSGELKKLGMSDSEFIASAIEIYGQETVFGTYINPETKAKISSTGARGEMQIVYPTFLDMVYRGKDDTGKKRKVVIGDKAYKAMGTTRAKVKAMLHDYKDPKKLTTAQKAGARKFLLDNHKANAVIAMAKMVNGMKAWKDAGNSLYDKVKRG